jgi:FkbM family methyltransferase
MEHDRLGETARLDRPEIDGLLAREAFVTFAQNYEDVRLWRIFHDVPAGAYIDIGAQEPTLDSVSRAFYDRGWRGINVEPNSHYADLLRADRQDEQVIEAAVSSRKGKIRFHASTDNGLSTGRDDLAAGHADAGFTFQEVEVSTITLDEVFELLSAPCQWLKIDVEGMESEVIESWKSAESRPVVVIVEATLPNSQIQSYEDWEPALLQKGYKFVLFDGLNRWYLRNDRMVLAEQLAVPISIFDRFQVTAAHPSVRNIVNNANERFTELEDSARASAEYALSLRSALDRLEKQYSDTASNLDSVNGQCATLHAELEATVARLNALQASNEDLKNRWAEKLRLSLARTTAARAEAASARRELEALNADYTRQLEAAESRRMELSRQVDEGRARLDQADARARTLQEDLTSISAKLAAIEVEARLKQAQAEAEALRAAESHSLELAACLTESEALRASLEAANEKLAQADQRARIEAGNRAELEIARNAALQAVATLERENGQFMRQMKKQVSDLERAERRNDRLVGQLSQLQQDLRELAARLDSKTSELGNALAREATLLAEVEQLGGRIAQMRDDNSATMMTLLRAEKELEDLKTSYSELQAVRDRQDDLIASLKSDLDVLREDVREGDDEVARLDKAVDRLNDDLRRATARSRGINPSTAVKRAAAENSLIWPIRLIKGVKDDRR